MRHSQLVDGLEVNNLHRSKSDPTFKEKNLSSVSNRQETYDRRANTPQNLEQPVKNPLIQRKSDKIQQCKLFAQSQFIALQKFKYTQMSNRIRIQTEGDQTPKNQRPQTPKSTRNPMIGYAPKQPQDVLKQYFIINNQQKIVARDQQPNQQPKPLITGSADDQIKYFLRPQDKKLFGQLQQNKSKVGSSSYHALNFNTFQKQPPSPSLHKDYSIQNLEKKAKQMTYDIYKSKYSSNEAVPTKNGQRELFKKIYKDQKDEKPSQTQDFSQQSNLSQSQFSRTKLQTLDSSKQNTTPNLKTRNKQSSLLDQFVTRVPQSNVGVNSPKSVTNGSTLDNTLKNTSSTSQNLKHKHHNNTQLENKENIYYVSSLMESLVKSNSNTQLFQLYREHFIQSFTAMNFCFSLQPTDQAIIDTKKVSLRRNDSLLFKKTIVFDLDETLIHCNESSSTKSDVYLPILFPTGQIIQAGINVRPYAFEILKELSAICEVIVFTASHQCYASKVIQFLDPKKQMISGMLFRENCVVTGEGVHIKDLRVINRDLKDMVLIDNAAYSFGYQVQNGIPIIPFYESKSDTELQSLLHYLKKYILPAQDVRDVVTQTFQFGRFNEFLNPQTAAEKMFGTAN